jgi:hypothetical protein
MSSSEGIKQSNSQEKAIMRHSKFSIHWSIRRLQLNLLTSTRLEMVARAITHFWLTERENTVVLAYCGGKALNKDLITDY